MGRWWRYKWITFHPSLTDATHDANQRADNAERISIELETKLNEMTAMVELRNSQISTLKSQYKEIMKLDPFNLEKRYNLSLIHI